MLVDVPCLSAQLDDSLLHMFRTHVARHSSVASHPPVQIEELVERPGGVLVRWCKASLTPLFKSIRYFQCHMTLLVMATVCV